MSDSLALCSIAMRPGLLECAALTRGRKNRESGLFKTSRRLGLGCLLAALLSAMAVSVLAAPQAALTLEQLFRAEPYRGENAVDPKFSRSGRYLAYLWNPFGEPGTDLYVHDLRSGKTLRLTSPALMAAFDAPEDIERFDKKLKQKRDEAAIAQARELAQAGYLKGQSVDLGQWEDAAIARLKVCLLYTSPSPRDGLLSRMPSSA